MPFGFVNGALMWGSALVSVPIIIHLLNRRRFRIIEWAAMEWLLLAIKQNKRRVTIEQLILLALRCLIIFLIVLAVSKIFLRSGSPAAGGLLGSSTDWVVVLDDSYSMGQVSSAATGSCFDRGRKEVRELLKRVASGNRKDSFTVVATERRERQPLAAPQLDRESVDRIQRRLEHLEPTDMRLTVSDLVERGLEPLRSSESANKALVLVTDCRLVDWKLTDAERAALKKRLDEAKTLGVKTYLIDVGPTDPRDYANVAVVDLVSKDKTVQTDSIAELVATVKNFGPTDASTVPVRFAVGTPTQGESVPETKTIDKVPAGGTETVTLFYKFRAPGSHCVTADIGTDSLPADNTRSVALEVTRGVDVLLVEGEPTADRAESETYALARALEPRLIPSGVFVRVVGDDVLNATHIEGANVVFLANVASLSEQNHKALLEFVRKGGGLVIFLGGRMDPATFNRFYFDGGKGIAPCALGDAVGDPAAATLSGGKFERFSTDYTDHPIMAVYRGDLAVLVTGARFYRRFAVRLPGDMKKEGVAVVARYDDADRSPAIVEKQIGQGKVVMLTSTADAAWNNWRSLETYPVIMHRLVEYLYNPPGGVRNLMVGARYVKAVDLAKYDTSVTVEPPKKSGALKRAAQVDASGAAVVTVDETRAAGVYALKFKGRPGAEGSPKDALEYFAVNLDVRESELRRPEEPKLRSDAAALAMTYGRGVADIWKAAPEERVNLWHLLLLALGCCMAVESFLGWKFGHHAK